MDESLKNAVNNENNTINQNSSRKRKPTFIQGVFEWIYTIAFALAVAFIVNNFIITNSFIPTGSMESTLPVGARVFGSRLHYLFSDIKRGDIVVFDYGYICNNPDCKTMYEKIDTDKTDFLSKKVTEDISTNYEELYSKTCPNCGRENKKNQKAYYIKRCIALPGDKVEIKYDEDTETSKFKVIKFKNNIKIKTGHVYINGEKINEPYLNEPMIVDDNFYKSFSFTVPEDGYFLLGDNRNNSEDARFWNQMFIPKKRIISKAGFIYWPFNRFGFVK